MSTTRGFYRELEKQPVSCGGLTRSSVEAAVMAVERRGQLAQMAYFSQPAAIVHRCSRDDESYEIKITPVIEQEEPDDGRLSRPVL